MSTCNESCLKVHESQCYSIWWKRPPHNEVPWYLMLPCPKVTLGVLREEHPKSLGVAPWRTFLGHQNLLLQMGEASQTQRAPHLCLSFGLYPGTDSGGTNRIQDTFFMTRICECLWPMATSPASTSIILLQHRLAGREVSEIWGMTSVVKMMPYEEWNTHMGLLVKGSHSWQRWVVVPRNICLFFFVFHVLL